MIGIDNWEERKAHYEEYWNYSNGIPLIAISAPKDGAVYDYETPDDNYQGIFDTQMEIRNNRKYFYNTYFGGDSYPYIAPTLGTDLISGILGLELHYNETSSWVKHLDCDLAEITDFTPDPDNFYLNRMDKILQELTEDAKNGDYVVAMVDLNTLMDGVSSLVGPQKLCLEMIDSPEEVKRVTKEHIKLYKDVFNRYDRIVTRYQKGNTNWLGIYSDVPWYFISNDFMVMVSGDFFDEFIEEPLRDVAAFHKRNLFHLDGENAVMHLDRILQIGEISGVQVQATPAVQSVEFWMPHLKKIQRAGKMTWIEARDDDEVMQLLRNLEPEGLFIRTWAGTQEQAVRTEKKLRQYYGR